MTKLVQTQPVSTIDAARPDAASSSNVATARFARALQTVWTASEVIVVIAIAVDLVITFANMARRFVFGGSWDWSFDVIAISLSAIAFVGGAAALRRGQTLAFTYVVDRVPRRWSEPLQAAGSWTTVAIALCTLIAFPQFFAYSLDRNFQYLPVSEAWGAVWMGIAYVLILLFCLQKLAEFPRAATVIGMVIAAVVGGAVAVCQWSGADPLWPMFLVAVFGFVVGMPIAFVLVLPALAFIQISGSLPLIAVPLAFQTGVGQYVLLAIPLFLVGGVLITITGMGAKLFTLLDRLAGHLPGGLLLVEVLAMYVFSGMSGSKTADIAGVASVMREPLEERGYPPGESVAVLAAGAAMGETIPPSIAMLILGSVTSLSITALFMGGLLPAAVLALTLMVGILYRARGGRLPKGSRFSLRALLQSIPPALPAISIPIILLGGLVGGIGTPTEVATFTVVYGVIVAAFAYRAVTISVLWDLLRDSAVMAGMVLLVISTASLLSESLVHAGIATTLPALLQRVSGGPFAFLIVATIGMVILGVFMEGLPALIVFGPLLLPIAVSFGIDPLQFGMIMIIAMGIGLMAPPAGVGLYIACAVGGARIKDALWPSAFYNVFLLVGLALVVLFPEITLVVPRSLGLLK